MEKKLIRKIMGFSGEKLDLTGSNWTWSLMKANFLTGGGVMSHLAVRSEASELKEKHISHDD